MSNNSVVMTTLTMHMPVRQLFLGRRAHICHFDGEMQGLSGQRVVAVDEHLAVFDLGHGDIDFTLWAATLKLHAGLDVLDALECFLRHFLHQLDVMDAVAIFRCHIRGELVTALAAFHLLFQARHDLPTAMQVGQRLATFGAVDDLALVVGQRVMESSNGVLGNLHERLTNRFRSAGQVPTWMSKFTRTVLTSPAAAGGGIRDTVAMSLPPSRFRHRFSAYLLVCAWLFAAPLAVAQEASQVSGASTAAALAAQIDAQISQPRFAQASWGIAVVSLDSGRALYTHRADQLLQPASTAKLFTAALSMNTLGADYRIPTRVLAKGDIRHGRLNGPLILYGMGDPTLGTATSVDWADQLASQLVTRGVRSVHGDLIADDGYFAGPSFGSGWEAGDLQSWFAVPSSALSVQENIVDLTVDPGTTAGLPARLSFDPVDAKPPLLGQLTTTLPRTQSDINLYRAPGENTLFVFGTIPANTPSQHFKLAVPDPALLAGAQLQQALARHGINISGKLQAMHWPHDDAALLAHTDTLAEVLSPPLLDILQSGLKRSQNLYLQNLLLSVGAHEQAALTSPSPTSGQFTSTEQSGIKALQQLLGQIGISPSASMITEGTGLSRRDLATPDALVRLLGYLAAQPYAAPLYEALPIAGVDGTLIGRMRHTPAENNVHAKTGSMEYVHCLVGYVTTAAGERLAFAIMLNNYEPPADGPRASSDVDAIAVLLAGFRGRG